MRTIQPLLRELCLRQPELGVGVRPRGPLGFQVAEQMSLISGKVGSCFDDAASEAFFSTLSHEVLSRHHFRTRAEARAVVVRWCQDFYNVKRGGVAGSGRVRENRCHPAGRSLNEASTISGETQYDWSAKDSPTTTSPSALHITAHRANPPHPRLHQTRPHLPRTARPRSSPPRLTDNDKLRSGAKAVTASARHHQNATPDRGPGDPSPPPEGSHGPNCRNGSPQAYWQTSPIRLICASVRGGAACAA